MGPADGLRGRAGRAPVRGRASGRGSRRIHLAGRLEVLPDSTRDALKPAAESTRDSEGGFHLNIAIGYDGREEIVR
ncbi:undecaprenyl diphosphate synthase family protein [Actinoplanes sichuanensis]|uniref:Undecaprenyl diphosphate synthase family protein n=1 Tax=Actinoplanes sichuanensis TaxID=512349 RepID=A0ABW4AGP8_9ACTN